MVMAVIAGGDVDLADVEQVVAYLAAQLGEKSPHALAQLRRAVELIGPVLTLDLLHDVQEIEAAGGMLTRTGGRRRTPGGVYFWQLRNILTPEEETVVFGRYAGPDPDGRGSWSGAAAALSPALTWPERLDVVVRAMEKQRGEVSTVKVMLIGRPGKIVDRGSCIVTSMQSGKAPSLPKGLPMPPAVTTSYVVYIAAKQWRRVAEAIQHDPEDALIVEGWAQLDGETQTVAVFALNTTTKRLQAAQREQQRAALATGSEAAS